ncbi:unnamed protein product [Ambrosiozyma monospora]|uniref:Unnamed protein product n=1 Tax=Ambrosiozyma monospora TaxID=43982 RepID=A0ACB5U8J4_AMBMO|nr:unnamed protein product [Ambrosiozyma monospora]
MSAHNDDTLWDFLPVTVKRILLDTSQIDGFADKLNISLGDAHKQLTLYVEPTYSTDTAFTVDIDEESSDTLIRDSSTSFSRYLLHVNIECFKDTQLLVRSERFAACVKHDSLATPYNITWFECVYPGLNGIENDWYRFDRIERHECTVPLTSPYSDYFGAEFYLTSKLFTENDCRIA